MSALIRAPAAHPAASPQITNKIPKKDLSPSVFLKTVTLSTIKKTCRNGDFDFFGRLPKSLQTFEPIRELAAHFNTNRVIGIYMIYNIYKFQEK